MAEVVSERQTNLNPTTGNGAAGGEGGTVVRLGPVRRHLRLLVMDDDRLDEHPGLSGSLCCCGTVPFSADDSGILSAVARQVNGILRLDVASDVMHFILFNAIMCLLGMSYIQAMFTNPGSSSSQS